MREKLVYNNDTFRVNAIGTAIGNKGDKVIFIEVINPATNEVKNVMVNEHDFFFTVKGLLEFAVKIWKDDNNEVNDCENCEVKEDCFIMELNAPVGKEE
jgi:hypothetical protein